jgi:hypothetical protein
MSFYMTGSTTNTELLRTKAEEAHFEFTSYWFEGTKNMKELVECIKKADKCLLILPTAAEVDDILFELGVIAGADLGVFVWYTDPLVIEKLKMYLSSYKLFAYTDWAETVESMTKWACIGYFGDTVEPVSVGYWD